MKPSAMWMLAESWKSRNSTGPSDVYIWSARFGGLAVSLAGIGGIAAAWFL